METIVFNTQEYVIEEVDNNKYTSESNKEKNWSYEKYQKKDMQSYKEAKNI